MAVFFRLVASLGRILSWWVQDYAYAAYWQVRGTLRPGRPDDLATGDRRPIVVIPGVWEPWPFLRVIADALHGAGHPVHVIPELGRNSRPVDVTAATVARFIDDRGLEDVLIVAHSKGGLIGKFVMIELDPGRRITGMVAICTPFAGSDYARFMAMRTLRAFSPRDPTTLRLQENLEVNAHITTITGSFDPHIPRLVALEGATNIVLDDGGHFRLLAQPEVIDIVVEIAARPAAVQERIADEVMGADASLEGGADASDITDLALPADAEVTTTGTPETPSVP